MNEKDETMQMAKVDFKCTVRQRTHSHTSMYGVQLGVSYCFPSMLFMHMFHPHGRRKA